MKQYKQNRIRYTLISGLIALEDKQVEKLIRQIEELKTKLEECKTNRKYIGTLRAIYRRIEFGNAHPDIDSRYWTDPDGKSSSNSLGERVHEAIKCFEKGDRPFEFPG